MGGGGRGRFIHIKVFFFLFFFGKSCQVGACCRVSQSAKRRRDDFAGAASILLPPLFSSSSSFYFFCVCIPLPRHIEKRSNGRKRRRSSSKWSFFCPQCLCCLSIEPPTKEEQIVTVTAEKVETSGSVI